MKQIQESEKLYVLIIEDNAGDFVLIEHYLLEQFKNIQIAHCSDFASSVHFLQNTKEKLSVILMDLNLPDLEGNALINGILSHTFQVPLIILTGYSDLAMAKSSLRLGASDYLVKDDINPVILQKTVVFALNRSSFINQIEDEKLNYENLFNFNPQPTWLLEAQTLKILNANIAAQNKYGFSLNDFRNMSFTELHPQEEEQLIKNRLIGKADEQAKEHFTHQLSNGIEIKVNIFFKEIKNNFSDALILQSNDITETLKRISTIEIQNAKLKNIAWTQSHGVRAPLSRILGILNLLEEQTESAEQVSYWLKQLRISTDEMDEIVKKIVEQTNHIELK